MTSADAVDIYELLEVAYPNYFKGQSDDRKVKVIQLWAVMFRKDDAKRVQEAVYAHLQECKFPPTIAEIQNQLSKIPNLQLETPGIEWVEGFPACSGWVQLCPGIIVTESEVRAMSLGERNAFHKIRNLQKVNDMEDKTELVEISLNDFFRWQQEKLQKTDGDE